ncbi:hypothetical protein CU097_005566, partial [Rhizopus azygosporus]
VHMMGETALIQNTVENDHSEVATDSSDVLQSEVLSDAGDRTDECIKNQDVQVEYTASYVVIKKETSLKKKRATQYNVYTDEDRRRYFHFLAEKLM